MTSFLCENVWCLEGIFITIISMYGEDLLHFSSFFSYWGLPAKHQISHLPGLYSNYVILLKSKRMVTKKLPLGMIPIQVLAKARMTSEPKPAHTATKRVFKEDKIAVKINWILYQSLALDPCLSPLNLLGFKNKLQTTSTSPHGAASIQDAA